MKQIFSKPAQLNGPLISDDFKSVYVLRHPYVVRITVLRGKPGFYCSIFKIFYLCELYVLLQVKEEKEKKTK